MAPRKADALSSLQSAPVKSCPESFDTLDNQNIIKIQCDTSLLTNARRYSMVP
jgi:hypothetical protein